MALLTWDNDGGASSISSDETIGGLSGSDFEGLDMDDQMSSFETGVMTPTYSSFSLTPPASPSIHAQLSAKERWAVFLVTYRQAVNHVRQVENEMFELRYSGLKPSISIDNVRSTIHRQSHQQLRPQSLFDINDDMQPTSRMWQGTHISPNLVQGARHLKLELNETVELSVVTLDILSRKKTTISLTAKSTGANLKQLLGFWEFNLSRNM